MKYGEVSLGQVEAVINKLGGMDGWNALLRDQLEIKPKSSPVFPKNKHGHYIIEVTGRDLTGAAEIELLTAAGCHIHDHTKSMLTSTNPDSYDALHRLEDGKVYKVAVVPIREVKSNRAVANGQAYGEQFGYGKPLAGLILRIRESVTDKQMEQMDIRYIAGLHDPIKDSVGYPRVFYSFGDGDGRGLNNSEVKPDREWNDIGAFAFFVPDSER